jgi:hypothetical protein
LSDPGAVTDDDSNLAFSHDGLNRVPTASAGAAECGRW